MQTIFKKMIFTGIALFGLAGVGFAQPTPAQIQQQQFQQQQQMMDAIRSDNMRNCGDEHGHGCRRRNTGPSAAEVRAWHARERKIQAEIAQLRATPYWMALAWDFDKDTITWPGGYLSEKRAIERAKQICSSPNCHVFATFNNTCAVLVKATDNPRSTKDLFIGINKDDVIAAEQAMKSCQAVYGVRKDRCFYTGAKTGKGLNGTAFCTGYDYSIYGQK